MVNVSIILGTNSYGLDILYKEPWACKIDQEHDVFVASRINSEIYLTEDLKDLIGETEFRKLFFSFENLENKTNFSLVYESKFFHKYSKKDILELENWLGIPFGYISSFSRLFYDKQKNKETRDPEDLNNYIAGLISFFKSFFIENDIKVMINTLEDTTFSVVAYFTAKKLEILVLCLDHGKFPKSGVTFYKDFNDIFFWKKKIETMNNIRPLYSESTIYGKIFMSKNIRYWHWSSILERLKNIRYLFKENRYKAKILEKYPQDINCFNNNNLFDIYFNYFKGTIRRVLVKKITKNPDWNDNYFFFPLHYSYDAQLTFKEPMIEQLELVKKILRALPTNHKLYIKPHPHYLGSDISFKKLYNLSRQDNIKIIDPPFPPKLLIDKSCGVITINSTAGFESLIMGKPVITVGHDFYCKDDLCFVVRDLNDLSEILLKVSRGESKSQDLIKNFIEMVYSNNIWIERFEELSPEDGERIAKELSNILIKKYNNGDSL